MLVSLFLRLVCLSAVVKLGVSFHPTKTHQQRCPITSSFFLPRRLLCSTASCSSELLVDTHMVMQGPEVPELLPTVKRLFLVRHGEVINPGNDRPVYYGAMDVPLSPLGEQEAVAAGQYLSQFKLSHVFSSPLSRAVYGAEQVCELQQQQQGNKSIVVEQLAGFKELDRGDWCGMTKEEIGVENLQRFDACDESVTPANGESYPALKRRVMKALHSALEKLQPGESGAVVSHLQVTRSILSDALCVPTDQMTTLPVATASVTCIDYDFQTVVPQITVHFQSFKPQAGLAQSKDGAN